MDRSYYLKKIKFILTNLTLIKYIFWCAFLYFQGSAIQKAVERKELFWGLMITLISFVVTKSIVMLIEILNTFFISFFENKEVHKQWYNQFPLRLFHDTENKDNLIYLYYFDYLPNLFNLKCTNIINICSVISIVSIVLFLVLYTQFCFGFISLLVVFILSFISKNIGLKSIDFYQKRRNEEKEAVFQWIHQYFKSYREIVFSWQEQIIQWSKIQNSSLYDFNKKIIFLHLIRNILSQLLVEVPFVINTSMIILGVYFQYLSITQLFIWIGLSQFVLQASNSYLEIKLNKIKIDNLSDKINEILSEFSSLNLDYNDSRLSNNKNVESNLCNELVQENRPQKIVYSVEIKLQDETSNSLSLSPDLYYIKGSNGSGKTTLLYIILGYERLLTIANLEPLQHMLEGISYQNIRVVEKNPIIFMSLKQFHHQILGPSFSRTADWKDLLKEKMNSILTLELINELSILLKEIELKFNYRSEKRFSSGEKVMISFFRAIYSWKPEVSLLIIDECTAFLDIQIKHVFMRCIKQLSKAAAIYLCTHEEHSTNSTINETNASFEKMH